MTTNPLWEVIQTYMDDPSHRYPPKPADLARETGVTDQVISKWKQRPILPTAEQLLRFSKGTGIPYLDLLEAALRGKGYLPLSGKARFAPVLSSDLVAALERQLEEGGEADGDAAATNKPGSRPGRKSDYVKAAREGEPALRKRRREHDEATEAIPDDPTGMEPI